MLTDEQVAEGLKRAREIQKREHRMSQDSEYREFCTCLPYPEATRRASVAEAERDEARQEAEWQQKRAIGAENRNDDLRLSCQEQSRAKCAAIERAEMAEGARRQARREAFEEAAPIIDQLEYDSEQVVEHLDQCNNESCDLAEKLATDLAVKVQAAADAIRALTEGEPAR
jgi:hypothetical protein